MKDYLEYTEEENPRNCQLNIERDFLLAEKIFLDAQGMEGQHNPRCGENYTRLMEIKAELDAIMKAMVKRAGS